MSAPTTRLLDTAEAAWYLAVTPRTVRSLWAQRKLPAVKVGNLVRFRVEDLEAFVQAQRIPAAR